MQTEQVGMLVYLTNFDKFEADNDLPHEGNVSIRYYYSDANTIRKRPIGKHKRNYHIFPDIHF